MKTVGEIRLENLEALVREFGTLDAVATRAESTSVYLSQLRNGTIDQKTGRGRQMGNAIARRLEKACNKPSGWMDAAHIHRHAQDGSPNEVQGVHGDEVGRVLVSGGVQVDLDEWRVDAALGSGYVVGVVVQDGYAARVVGSARDRSLRDGQYLVIEKEGRPQFGDFCILETRPGVQKLVEVLGSKDGRMTFEEIMSGNRLTRNESELGRVERVVAVFSGSRWLAANQDRSTYKK
jgi:hypothetical protein